MANIKFSQFSVGNNLQVGDTVVGLRSATNTKFTFPGTGISDASGNAMVAWASPGASAVNYITLNSSNTGVNPSIVPTGSDSDIGLTLDSKGNGNINLLPAGTGIITMHASTRFANGSAIQTGMSNSDSLTFQAYDVDGSSYTTFATLTAGNTPTLAINATSLTLTTPLALTSGGTGTATAFTSGSLVFAGASGVYTQDNANLFWDDTNNRLGVGTNVPGVDLDVDGTTATIYMQCQNFLDVSGDLVLQLLHNSSPVNSFYMFNSATGIAPVFAVQGSDSNIGISIVPKGTGQLTFFSSNASPVIFSSGTGNQHSTIFAFPNTANIQTVTFPDASGTVAFTSTASGVVNAGTANQLAYYATNGTAVSGLTTQNNSVVVTDGSGVPSLSTTLPSALTIPTPKIDTINDTSANSMMTLTPVASAVNYFEFVNAITTTSPTLNSRGSDTNIGLILATKGTGSFNLKAGSTTPFTITSGTSLQHAASFVFNSSSSSQTITFPDGNGTVSFTGGATLPFTNISGTSQTAAVNNGYIIGNSSLTTVSLPTSAVIGDLVAVEGLGAGGWVLQGATLQTIIIGSSTTLAAGTLASTNRYDNVYVTCVATGPIVWKVRTTNSAGLTVT